MRSERRRVAESEASQPEAGDGWLRAQLVLALLLLAFWLLWSGLFIPLLLALGTLSSLLVVYIVKRMGYFDTRIHALRYNFRLIGFWLWLLREIVRSSIEVARVVLSMPMRLHTEVVEVPVGDLDAVDQALLGNSITLTPGTLTVDTRGDRLVVHALTPAGAQSLRDGDMKRRVIALRRAKAA